MTTNAKIGRYTYPQIYSSFQKETESTYSSSYERFYMDT